MRRFNSSQTVGLLGVTLTVLGFAAGPLLFGPSSEIYGRRPVYLACGLLYSAFAFGVAFANNMPVLLVFRFFCGLFGSAQINNVPASIGDFTVPANRGPYSIICASRSHILSSRTKSADLSVPSSRRHLRLWRASARSSFFIFRRDAGGLSVSRSRSARREKLPDLVDLLNLRRWNLRVIAIFCTLTSLLAAFVPESHHPTLMRQRAEKESSEPVARKSVADVVRVYKGALSRPFIFLFTGTSQSTTYRTSDRRA